MIGTGLQMQPTGGTISVGGAMTAQSLGSMRAQATSMAQAQAEAEKEQQQPTILELAGHIKSFWHRADEAKRPVELAMIEAMYARRGEYTPEKYSQVVADGQPPIYMMLAASKMRQAESLLRDVLIGAGTEKPWTIEPTPVPDLPPLLAAQIKAAFVMAAEQAIGMGYVPSQNEVVQLWDAVKTQQIESLREAALESAERMEGKMEDQLVEGGFTQALDGFISDLTTFKAAFIAGPIIRRKPQLAWLPGNPEPVVNVVEMMEWERVNPFDIYPAPWARTIDEGPLIRRHKLTREALNEMLGVDGFSDASIKMVLAEYGDGGLHDWLSIDSEQARAEGKVINPATSESGTIDALQYWGSVSGKMLAEWGMKDVKDFSAEYQVEAWLIGPYVIKAVMNSDPLARRPIYADSYERIPGTIWGNSVYDMMEDCQLMCNAAARALAGNLGISSGPQVVVNVSRLPSGENISQMYPWKIWQVKESSFSNDSQKPIEFFQPSSNAAELMGVYEKFSGLADEYTGIPRYMTGNEGTPGAGRTASGLSMMIGNASKIIKQVVGSVDMCIFTPLLERLYYTNMRYATDPDLKGDVRCVARGAMSLTTKEAAQVRRNEFLAATNNPVDLQIMGMTGRAEVLRASASELDLNPSKIVPPTAVIKLKEAAAQAQAAMQPQQEGAPGEEQAQGGGGPSPNGQQLMNGAPQTDNFQPPAKQGGQ